MGVHKWLNTTDFPRETSLNSYKLCTVKYYIFLTKEQVPLQHTS